MVGSNPLLNQEMPRRTEDAGGVLLCLLMNQTRPWPGEGGVEEEEVHKFLEFLLQPTQAEGAVSNQTLHKEGQQPPSL